MQKLFLTSSFQNVINQFLDFLSISPKELTVGFVPTAADPYEDKWFVEADRRALIDAGFKVKEINIKDKQESELRKAFQTVDIIFVAGGNTFYLLKETKKSGFDKIVKDSVARGVVYIGSSAGSYLVCPTIEASTWKHHDSDRFGVTDFSAIGLVPFLMTVHFKPEYEDILRKAIPNAQYPVKILADEQALAVEGENVSLVGKGEEIKL